MIEHLDQCVGRLVAKLEERGELENTLVVFASDHGEMLGDYGQWQKKSPLQAAVGVPLVLAGPGVRPAQPNAVPISLMDLHGTFLEFDGLEISRETDSRSMKRLLAGETEHHRMAVASGLGSWRLAYDGRFKLILGYDPELRTGGFQVEPMAVKPEEAARLQGERPPILYDLRNNERDNIAPDCPEIVERLAQILQDE